MSKTMVEMGLTIAVHVVGGVLAAVASHYAMKAVLKAEADEAEVKGFTRPAEGE